MLHSFISIVSHISQLAMRPLGFALDWWRFYWLSIIGVPETSVEGITHWPNQAMKLTATAVRLGHAFLSASFLSLRAGLCPSGRSLSFSR
jgi:hypothetical protein